MNRLQKKCFFASTGLHLVLVFVLIVGPAFLMPGSRTENLPTLDFVPVKTVDALISGGGNPKAQPPPPAPPTPTPPAPAEALPTPTPPETAKVSEPETRSLEVSKERKRKVEVSTKLVVRKTNEPVDARAAEKRARDEARRQQAASAIGQAVRGIEGGLSGSTTIELKGPGGGGLPYANWKQAVKSVYDRAWLLPVGVAADAATAAATVTIARDGEVISAKLTRFSGNGDVDQSVQATLDRVRFAAPLPDDAKENERTITIYFDVNAKLRG
jgi:periplasmic protein TonB